jgi:hypothetical protein
VTGYRQHHQIRSAFRDWGYEIAKSYFSAKKSMVVPGARSDGKPGAGLVIERDRGCSMQQVWRVQKFPRDRGVERIAITW